MRHGRLLGNDSAGKIGSSVLDILNLRCVLEIQMDRYTSLEIVERFILHKQYTESQHTCKIHMSHRRICIVLRIVTEKKTKAMVSKTKRKQANPTSQENFIRETGI